MQEKITIFNAENRKSKHPTSPYGDNSFTFQTFSASSNAEMFEVLVSNFVLNIPLGKQDKPFRTYRRKKNLESFYNKTITYFILDIDDVKNKRDEAEIINFFKKFKVVLGESKSYNGIDNFNMKGILFTDEILISDAKMAISELHQSLKDLCVIDECVIRKVSLNAPILRNNVFLNNENGERYAFVKPEVGKSVSNDYNLSIPFNEIKKLKAESIGNLCLCTFQAMGFCAVKTNVNDSISFKHPTERKSTGGYFWFNSSPYTMHHPNSVKTVNIFDLIKKIPAGKELMAKDLNYSNEFQNFNTVTNVIHVNEKYLSVSDDLKNTIDTFLADKNGLFSIKSPMGTGKSTIIEHIIDESHQLDMRVLVITNRISVANDFGTKYNLKVYNKDKYNYGDSLVCQFDSLWKYNLKFFDIVIMDEFVSVMTHARSGLSDNKVNIAKFFGTFKKKLVIADAFLTGYENFLLSNKTSNVHMLNNSYRDDTTLYDYENQNHFIENLVFYASKYNVTVSATSISFINKLEKLLSKRNMKVVTLTASTASSTKDIIYGLFNVKEHDKWNVLIYSPTLTVGVSNLNDVKYHFHYDSSMSADAVSSIQMIKRTRKAQEIHMFVKPRINYVKTSYNAIRDEYMNNISNVSNNFLFEVDDYGEIKLSTIGKKSILIDTFKNILEFNHREAVLWLLQYHFKSSPIKIDTVFTENLLSKYARELKNEKNTSIKNNVKQYLALNSIEKSELLKNTSSSKILKSIYEIDENIISTTDSVVLSSMLELCVKDGEFIQKCQLFNCFNKFTGGEWGEIEIKEKISKSIIKKDDKLLFFFNTLLAYGQSKDFQYEYKIKDVVADKKLRTLLKMTGYANETSKNSKVVGQRMFKLDENVKKYYEYV